MSAATATRAPLRIPALLPHQVGIYRADRHKKLWRAGRRTGKSVLGRVMAVRGHGPKVNGRRRYKGMLAGGKIAWLTKSYKQAKVVWRKLLKAFRPLEGRFVTIDREDKRIEMIVGTGCIAVWSGHTRDAIDNVRGDDYDGVLVDEAAYLDLEYGLREVFEPALLDRPDTWLFIFSTPNAGWDKNEERQTPSYFNRLVQDIEAGKLPTWAAWHNRTADNPRLNKERLAELRAELTEESVTVQQELDALLVVGGLLALKIDRAALLIEPFDVPRHWTFWGSYDWGHAHPFSFGLYATDEEGVTYRLDTATAKGKEPAEITVLVREVLERHALTFADLRYTVAGTDIWGDKSKATGNKGPTIAEQHNRLGWKLIPAKTDRVLGLNNLRRYLSTRRLRIVRTRANLDGVAVLEQLITNPKEPEDSLKRDAINGKGGDDFYDELRYGLMSRPIAAPALPEAVPQGKAPPREQVVRRQAPKKAAAPPPRQQVGLRGTPRPTYRPQVRAR